MKVAFKFRPSHLPWWRLASPLRYVRHAYCPHSRGIFPWLSSPWRGNRCAVRVFYYSRHQIPSNTLICPFSSNVFLLWTEYFFNISQSANICLKNRYFEELIDWMPQRISRPPKRRFYLRRILTHNFSKRWIEFPSYLSETRLWSINLIGSDPLDGSYKKWLAVVDPDLQITGVVRAVSKDFLKLTRGYRAPQAPPLDLLID